jgi:hypothetical protein
MGDVNGDWLPSGGDGPGARDMSGPTGSGRAGVLLDAISVAFPDTSIDPSVVFAQLPIVATEFDSVGAISLRATFADTVLCYEDVYSRVQGVTFISNLVGDEVRIEWYDPTGGLNPICIGTDTLLAVEFELVGELGEASPLHFTSACVIGNETGDPITDVTFIDGSCLLGSNVGVAGAPAVVPRFALHAVRPAPCRWQATFTYDLARGGKVSLHVYDVSGRLVRTLVDRFQPPGQHSIAWAMADDSGGRVPSGVYFVRMRAGAYSESRKFLVLR